jgi:hypothetical protein
MKLGMKIMSLLCIINNTNITTVRICDVGIKSTPWSKLSPANLTDSQLLSKFHVYGIRISIAMFTISRY